MGSSLADFSKAVWIAEIESVTVGYVRLPPNCDSDFPDPAIGANKGAASIRDLGRPPVERDDRERQLARLALV